MWVIAFAILLRFTHFNCFILFISFFHFHQLRKRVERVKREAIDCEVNGALHKEKNLPKMKFNQRVNEAHAGMNELIKFIWDKSEAERKWWMKDEFNHLLLAERSGLCISCISHSSFILIILFKSNNQLHLIRKRSEEGELSCELSCGYSK